MAEKKKKSQGDAHFWPALVVLAMFLCFLLMPEGITERSLMTERGFVVEIIGEEAELELFERAAGWVNEVGLNESIDTRLLSSSNRSLGRWVDGRFSLLEHWVALSTYRVSLMFAWAIVCLPFMMAVSYDGYNSRRIRQYAFVHQSPFRHRRAAQAVISLLIMLPMAALLPIPLPPIIMPLVMLIGSGAGWVWFVNLQKRI